MSHLRCVFPYVVETHRDVSSQMFLPLGGGDTSRCLISDVSSLAGQGHIEMSHLRCFFPRVVGTHRDVSSQMVLPLRGWDTSRCLISDVSSLAGQGHIEMSHLRCFFPCGVGHIDMYNLRCFFPCGVETHRDVSTQMFLPLRGRDISRCLISDVSSLAG